MPHTEEVLAKLYTNDRGVNLSQKSLSLRARRCRLWTNREIYRLISDRKVVLNDEEVIAKEPLIHIIAQKENIFG